jgi:two-component system, OmpR family, sensor histidine kinase BaeS
VAAHDRYGPTARELRRQWREEWRDQWRGERRHRLHGSPWAHGPWRAGERPRPPWWPEGEAWPPAGDFPWHAIRRRFFLRVAIAVAIVFALVVAGPIIVIALLLNAAGLSGTGSAIVVAAVLAVLIVGLGGTARSARRLAVPIGDLVEAAGRVESGDFAARVAQPRRAPRELRWLIEAFNSMTARLEVDERQRRDLLADVSHELRTPLAVLRGEIEAMIDGIHAMDQVHLTAAVDQVAIVTRLVEDLRTLSLAEAGTLALHREPTDLSILAHEVAGSFDAVAAAHGVTVRTQVEPDVPLLDVDPLRVTQILSNLVGNALRYAPTGTAVELRAARAGSAVAVSVSDHGPGIDPTLLPHVFDRFVRSDDSRGSGLGLAIARRLVEAHGGSIRAERPSEGGTSIRFELPLSE